MWRLLNVFNTDNHTYVIKHTKKNDRKFKFKFSVALTTLIVGKFTRTFTVD